MITLKEKDKIDKLISFHRDHSQPPTMEDWPTPADDDKSKLPALERLLIKMHEFKRALDLVSLFPQKDYRDTCPNENCFNLTDSEHAEFCHLEIFVQSDWFNLERNTALHKGFKFILFIKQGLHSEASDWINIVIEHFDTTPFSFASSRGDSRCLKGSHKGLLFFEGLNLGCEISNWDYIRGGSTFNTNKFNQTIDDACLLLQKLIDRKEHLRTLTKIR